MMTAKHPLYFAIHGHFYQPPRENPWTGAIEHQPSAAPHHDWNKRIAKECYGPNSASRILDQYGRIQELVNNYEYMSFNIGPTLMSWIRFNMPEVYARIQLADRKSTERLGHGNAIAQVYNHIIMPLASAQDRLTQIRWGIRDFEFHYGRKPEAMWLAETAIDMKTVVDLIQEGIRFTVLSPTQAESFRAFGGTDWTDCSNTDIDPTRPYRIYPRDEKGRPLCEGHLDVFFYHPWLSSAVGFEHLLRSADTFGARIHNAWDPERPEPQLVSIATDGESYGHHEAFGDMCAAWLLKRYSAEHDMVPVNFGWFLEKFPPVHEVQLKNAHGEGCAWSCAHGVGRWYRDCGCSTGGPGSWNQKWRGPLRDALNHLKEVADTVFVNEFARISDLNPWDARNRYVEVLLHPSDLQGRHQFLSSILRRPESTDDQADALALLELQKFCLFSFTSCGWFFNDIEGIEPIQNLRYALRAIELIRRFEVFGDTLQVEFLGILARATGNASGRNGAELFVAHVRQAVPAWLRLLGEAAARLHLSLESTHTFELESCRVHVQEQRKDSKQSLFQFHLELLETMEQHDAAVLVLNDHLERTHLFIVEGSDAIGRIQFPVDSTRSPAQILKQLPKALHLRVKDLFTDSLNRINHLAADRNLKRLANDFQDFAQRYTLSLDCLADPSGALPGVMRESLSISINTEIYRIALRALDLVTPDLLEHCKELIDEVNALGVQLSYAGLGERIHERVKTLLQHAAESYDEESVNQITGLITLADWMRVDIDKTSLENLSYPAYLKFKEQATARDKVLRPMFEWLNFAQPSAEE